MKIQESAQDYLEAILILSKEKDFVRAADICDYFGYARPTVSEFLKQLKENEYIIFNEKKHISLTKKGEQIAKDMLERHKVLTNIFEKIGVSKDTAVVDACRVEHYVSEETYLALKNYFKI